MKKNLCPMSQLLVGKRIKGTVVYVLTMLLILCFTVTGQAQTVFNDDFTGSTINANLWDVHDNTWNLQRTRFGKTPQILNENGTTFARIAQDTYNPSSPGTAFFGTEMWTKQQFQMGPGTEFEARIRAPQIPRGVVYAFFTYRQRNFQADTDQEEIDFEFLGNQPLDQLWLNIWNGNVNSNSTSPVATGLNRTGWNVYTMRWLNDRVVWLVNGIVVRTQLNTLPGTNLIPDDAMSVCFNIWAADSGWTTAFDSTLQPTSNPAQNSSQYFDVDYVKVTTIPHTGPGVGGGGEGLTGTYFDNADLTNPKFDRLDHRINFNWTSNAPGTGINPDTWSVRWSGRVQAQFTEPYTFSAYTDDGVRLYINNQLIINRWQNVGNAAEVSGTINLTAGQLYDIRMEYADVSGDARALLYWSSPSTSRQFVPPSQLYPLQVDTPTFSPAGGFYSPGQTVTVSVATPGADIHYTLDGSEPLRSSPLIASGGTLTINGTMTLKAKAWRDGYWASNTQTAVFSTDQIAPSASITIPTAGFSYTSLSQVTGTANDVGSSGVQSVTGHLYRYADTTFWNGSAWTAADVEVIAQGTTNWAYALPSLADGRYAFRATVRDAAGNVANTNSVDFYIDTIAPTLTVTAPTAGGGYNSFAQASGTAVDTGPGVAQVTAVLFRYADSSYWNGSAWTSTVSALVATGTTNWTVSLPPLTDGRYAFAAGARDYVGNTTVSPTINFFIDKLPPVLALTNLPSGAVFRSFAQVTGTASDAASGVAGMGVWLFRYADSTYWNGSAWVSGETYVPITPLANWTYNLPALSDGRYSFRAVARDAAGNVGLTATNDFLLDNGAPTVKISTPVANGLFTSAPAITGTAADAVGVQVVRCQLYRYADKTSWNGSTWTSGPSGVNAIGTTSWSFNPPALNDGRYAIFVMAVDGAGNTSAASTLDFQVDKTPPTVSITAPANGAIFRTFPAVSGRAGDNFSGVSFVSITVRRSADGRYWNGSSWITTVAYLPTVLAPTATGVNWSLTTSLPNGTNLPDGPYTIAAITGDKTTVGNVAGNGRGNASVSITVQNDAQAPVVSFTSPIQGATITRLPYILGRMSDTGGSGIARVDLSIQRRSDNKFWTGAAWVSRATTLATLLGSTNWAYRSGLPAGSNLTAGQYVLQATATDRGGNKRSASITIRVGTTATVTSGATAIAPASTVKVSTVAASVSSQSVRLTFLAALDAEVASDPARYQVEINGQVSVVESAAYAATSRSVTLGLPEGALKAGDRIVVKVQGLRDAQGLLLQAASYPVVAR